MPTAPRIAISQTDSATITASWASNGDGGSALTGYTITLSSGSCSFSFVSGTTSYSCPITGVSAGSAVTATVLATNLMGNSATTTSSALTFISSVGAPTSLVATDGDGQVSIAFAINANGDSIVSYDYSLDGTSFMPAVATASPVVITGLTNGVAYNVYLRAKGAVNGNGAVSVAIVASPRIATSATATVSRPPASAFVVVTSPKISRTNTSYICTSGSYSFKRLGGTDELSKLSSQLIKLLSNGSVVDSTKTLSSKSTFDAKASYKGSTLSCEVLISQEGIEQSVSSLDLKAMAEIETSKTAAMNASNYTYYTERDSAYLKRNAGDNTSWKDMLDKAVAKRESSKLQAEVDYIANLEKAGISILVALDKAEPKPTPTPTPTSEATKTANVQPAAMIKVGNIYFATGTSFLNDEAKRTIKALASSIFMKAPSQVLSYGFTDSKGGTDNTLLSQNRSKAVAKLLRALLPGQKIVTGWYASSNPVATGTSKAALAQNRRVEIYIK